MKMVICERFMKCLLASVNLLILIITIILIFGSGYVLLSMPPWIGESPNNQFGEILFASLFLEIATVTISIIGIITALRGTKGMLRIYCVIVSLLLVIGIINSVRQRKEFNNELLPEKEMEKFLQFYNDEKLIRNFWDTTQSTYQCCGINSWKDWKTHGLQIPDSCCESGQLLDCKPDRYTINISKVYAEGCINQLRSVLQQGTNIGHSMGITLLCLQALGIILSFVLCRAHKIKQSTSNIIIEGSL